MIGYKAGRSPLHRAHPYTPLTAASAVLLLAFAVSTPGAIGVVALAAVTLALIGDATGAIARPMLVLVLPTWALLLVLHGIAISGISCSSILGGDPHLALGSVTLSEPGVRRALVLGGRITAIVIAFLTALATVSPPRLVEAMTARGVPFGRIFLLVSTLTLVPRMRARAAQILDAQQCRGLRIGGSPAARVRALVPLVLPLVLGALAEVDEQVLALDARGAASDARRTVLDPPTDAPAGRMLRWMLLALVLMAYAAKFAGRGA